MRDDLNGLFDMHLFTIIHKIVEQDNWEYRVVVSDIDERVTAELEKLNDVVIAFIDENTRPSPQFLEHHNQIFYLQQEDLKAASEPNEFRRIESGGTITRSKFLFPFIIFLF